MTSVDTHFDMAKKPIRLGDIVAYSGRGYHTGLHIGRVIRLCDKQAVMREARLCQNMKLEKDQNGKLQRYNDGPATWVLQETETYIKNCHEALVIVNPAATIPIEVFVMFENLEITGKRPRPEKKKK